MKTISIQFRPNTRVQSETNSSADYGKGCRILVRTKNGIVIGKLIYCKTQNSDKSKQEESIFYMITDAGKRLKFKGRRAILGEGISRQRRTPIPDDELFMWKKDVRSLSVKQSLRQNKKSHAAGTTKESRCA